MKGYRLLQLASFVKVTSVEVKPGPEIDRVTKFINYSTTTTATEQRLSVISSLLLFVPEDPDHRRTYIVPIERDTTLS